MNKTNSDRRIKQFCETVIAKRLGDISTLPDRLARHVVQVYADFISAYLNVLRQKEGKPQDWFPDSLSIDPALENEMRHFFSDYQHITNAFRTLNKKMDELLKIDRDKQPNLYEHTVTSILTLEHR
jgi:hypothetical protein